MGLPWSQQNIPGTDGSTGMPRGTLWWPKLAKNQCFWYRLEIHLFLCSYQALTFPHSPNLEARVGCMWGAAKKESPNPLSCRRTWQPSPCPPGFAEHTLLHGQCWMLFLHICRRIPNVFFQVSAPQCIFSHLMFKATRDLQNVKRFLGSRIGRNRSPSSKTKQKQSISTQALFHWWHL